MQHQEARPAIYFIQVGKYGPVKVGYTEDGSGIRKRLKSLQTAHHTELRSRAVLEGGTRQDERHLHKLLKKWNIRGEWFEFNSPVADAIHVLTKNPDLDKHQLFEYVEQQAANPTKYKKNTAGKRRKVSYAEIIKRNNQKVQDNYFKGL